MFQTLCESQLKSKKFSILDYLDKLEPQKGGGKRRFHCPVCGAKNLTVNLENGAYNNHSCDCTKEEIRHALNPSWQKNRGVLAEIRSLDRQEKASDALKKRKQLKPAPMPSTALLAHLNGNVEHPEYTPFKPRTLADIGQCQQRSIFYPYSDTQWVERVEVFKDGDRVKKSCYPNHKNEKGETVKKKGSEPWLPYRFIDVQTHAKGKFILIPEGEQCTEKLREFGLVASTFNGNSWSDSEIEQNILQLKKAEIAGIAYLPDNDKPGFEKSEKVRKACAKWELPFVQMDLRSISNEAIEDDNGFDVCDFYDALTEESKDKITQVLDHLFKTSIDDAREQYGTGDPPDGNEKGDNNGDDDEYPENSVFYIKYPVEFERQALQRIFYENWCVIKGAFYHYNGHGYWDKKEDSHVKDIITYFAKNAYTLKRDGDEIIKHYRFMKKSLISSAFECIRMYLNVSDMPANDHLIAFMNGTLDTRTGELLAHNPEHFLQFGIASNYEPGKECPATFKHFILDTFGEELMPLIRAVLGMYLDVSSPSGYFVHLIGPSGSGKGTFLRFICSMFSESSTRSIGSFKDIATAEGRHQNLAGTRLCCLPDIGGYQTGLKPFYELVDNGAMSGRALFNPDGYQKTWNVKFIIASVLYLQIENSGDGWARRCIPLPTQNRKIVCDPALQEKLNAVRGDVISWALTMPREERNALLMNAESIVSVAKIKHESEVHGDSVGSFIDQCLTPVASEVKIPVTELHELYKAFCKIQGYTITGYNKFASSIKLKLAPFYRDRLRQKVKGKTVQTFPAHFVNLDIALPGLFGVNRDGEFYEHQLGQAYTSNPDFVCLKARLCEGGLEDFTAFDNEKEAFKMDAETREACMTVLMSAENLDEFNDVRREIAELSDRDYVSELCKRLPIEKRNQIKAWYESDDAKENNPPPPQSSEPSTHALATDETEPTESSPPIPTQPERQERNGYRLGDRVSVCIDPHVKPEHREWQDAIIVKFPNSQDFPYRVKLTANGQEQPVREYQIRAF